MASCIGKKKSSFDQVRLCERSKRKLAKRGGRGETPSQERMGGLLSARLKRGQGILAAFTDVIAELEEALRVEGRSKKAGSCANSVLICGRFLWCANLGDCRAAYIALDPLS